jgi:hypothetical protein
VSLNAVQMVCRWLAGTDRQHGTACCCCVGASTQLH